MEKKEQYDRLVSDVRTDYLNNDHELKWCEECKEINLWTYWQGRNHMDAQIMLVGQDWGCPWDNQSAMAVMETVRAINDGRAAYYMTGNDNPTDNLLIHLFQTIGFDIKQDEPRLFFTNFVLGYRAKGTSGNFKSSWATADAKYFRRLVEIIRPRVLLCLGRDTAKCVLECYGLSLPKGNYNNVIESNSTPFRVVLSDGSFSYIFALAHCGVMGTLSRNKGTGKKLLPDLQVRDWSHIRPYFWSSPQLLHGYWEPIIRELQTIVRSEKHIAWCKEYSVYSACEDEYGIRKLEEKLIEETYHNGLVIADYREKMSELGLDERNVMRAEKEWVEQLSIEGAVACLAYHFRRDHFCEGSLIQKGIADGCILRLMERLYKLLSAIS